MTDNGNNHSPVYVCVCVCWLAQELQNYYIIQINIDQNNIIRSM